MITTVLFDLDGTLLPMDQERFVKTYFQYLAARVAPLGYEPKSLIDAIWRGTGAMVRNSGEKKNEDVFWNSFSEVFGEKCRQHIPEFDAFYRTDFNKVQEVCGFQPMAKEIVEYLKSEGKRVILATNPIFPQVATYARIGWAGLKPEDFTLITTYENSTSCKPNLAYYKEIFEKAGVVPEECLMVGNDVEEDMVAKELGVTVFLLTDCLINRGGEDVSCYPHGGFAELLSYLKSEVCSRGN